MCLPTGRGHDRVHGGPVWRLQQRDQHRLLGASVLDGLFGGRPVARAFVVCRDPMSHSGFDPNGQQARVSDHQRVPWPSPVSRQSGSPRRRLASTSCSQPRSIILVTAIFAAAPARPLGSGMAMLSGRRAAAVRTMVWVSVSFVMALPIGRGWQGMW